MWLMFPEIDRILDRQLSLARQLLPPARDGVAGPSYWPGALAARARLVETEVEYVFELDLPGVQREAVEVEAHEGVLRVAGKRTLDAPEGYEARLAEREPFSFERRFRLPAKVDLARTSAELALGVLRVKLPKLAEPQPNHIPVQ